ncbi:MAG: terminase small subunit [Patescibacteria group bacterium]
MKNNVTGTDADDIKIEKGDLDPPEENMFYPKGVLTILNTIFRSKKHERPRGKESPTFSKEEVTALADLIFFKSPHVVLKVYERLPRKSELPLRRKMFVHYLVGDARGNAAKAARLAGYSPRSAKQIAHKLLRS